MKSRGRAPILCVVGRKNAGKTGVTVALASELTRRGYRVMTVKSRHGFQVDRPGKDSWRHRHEGSALRSVLAGPRDFAVVGRWPGERMTLREIADRFLYDADLVLAEGAQGSGEARVEVFRKAAHSSPLFMSEDPTRPAPLAVVTDDPDLDTSIPVVRFDNPDWAVSIADLVENTILETEDPDP